MSPALERIPAGEKAGTWDLIKPPGLLGDPLEQLVRHFLIETGPKGVKIKGCPSEPYFGKQQGLGMPHWVGLGKPGISGGWREGWGYL